MTSFVPDATTFGAPTNDGRTDATIDHTTTKRTVISIESARGGSHRRGAASIIATTKIGNESALGASHRLSTTGNATPATNVD